MLHMLQHSLAELMKECCMSDKYGPPCTGASKTDPIEVTASKSACEFLHPNNTFGIEHATPSGSQVFI